MTITKAGMFRRSGTPATRGARLQEGVDRRIGTEERRPVAVSQEVRQMDAEHGEQRREIAAPCDRDRDVADRVLQDQIPADDPRDELPQRGVRVRVGAPRLRDHRGQLRVAERGKPADHGQQGEGDNERRAGAVPHDLARGQHLARRGGPDGREDAGANHRPDRQHDQIAGAHDALQT